jgi:murein DD-endopeptidase MepM/ murein hydrolase activator NlpD
MRRVPPPPPRPSRLGRLAIAAVGFLALGIGWRMTSGEPASAAAPDATALDASAGAAVPADYVPDDSAALPATPVDPLGDELATPAPSGPGAPLDFLRVTSSYGLRRHPILGFTRMHQGVDFAAREGAPVLAAEAGVVSQAGPEGGYGNLIRIRHARGWATGYAHLSGYAPGVAPGAHVERGQVIGFVGHTGLATGPHLHFEVSLDGVKLDPMTTPFGGVPATDPHAGAYAKLRPALTVDTPAA